MRENSRDDLNAMIELGMRQDFEAGTNRAAARVIGAVHQLWHTRLNHGTGTHRTRFESHVESRARKAIVVEDVCRFADDDDFGVGRGVVIANGAVAGERNDFVFIHEQGADRNLTGHGGCAGFFESKLHVLEISGHGERKNNMQRSTAPGKQE